MRHIGPHTGHHPRGPLWLALVAFACAVLLLALMFSGCAVGPYVSSTSGFGYSDPAVGALARAEATGERAMASADLAATTATKFGNDQGGAAVLRAVAGPTFGRLSLLAGVRGGYQRADGWTVTSWQPVGGISYRGQSNVVWQAFVDFPDDTTHRTCAIVGGVYYPATERLTIHGSAQVAQFDGDRTGYGIAAALLYRLWH